ncbi:hypothetical protein [Marmoricola sp. RAF53]|uniref:hypothetical protein n=1 Tax=Marmoricola sp. RAF53 TaxID=3233059 RepID=UPI003F98DF02
MSTLIAASPLGLVARWSSRSQEQARRNAMAACTVLTARRHERLEVESFIAGYLARYETAAAAEPALAVPVRRVG